MPEETGTSAARTTLPLAGAAVTGVLALALVRLGVFPASRVAMLRGMAAGLM